MKSAIHNLLRATVTTLVADGQFDASTLPSPQMDRTCDLATNLALALAKQFGIKPRELAQQLVNALPAAPLLARVEIAGLHQLFSDRRRLSRGDSGMDQKRNRGAASLNLRMLGI